MRKALDLQSDDTHARGYDGGIVRTARSSTAGRRGGGAGTCRVASWTAPSFDRLRGGARCVAGGRAGATLAANRAQEPDDRQQLHQRGSSIASTSTRVPASADSIRARPRRSPTAVKSRRSCVSGRPSSTACRQTRCSPASLSPPSWRSPPADASRPGPAGCRRHQTKRILRLRSRMSLLRRRRAVPMPGAGRCP